MNLKRMKILDIIVGVTLLFTFFLSSFLIFEYSTLADDFKFILWIVLFVLILVIVGYYEKFFCKNGIKKFDSSLVDKNIRKKLMNYFLKENFVRNKYNDDGIEVYENKQRSNMIFRSYVVDLKIVDANCLEPNLVGLFEKLIEETSITKKPDKSDLWCRNFVFLITDEYDEEKFNVLDKYTFIKPVKNRYFTSEDLGAFVIPIVLCTEEHCIYFTNPARYPFFFEKRKIDVLKLFEIDSK